LEVGTGISVEAADVYSSQQTIFDYCYLKHSPITRSHAISLHKANTLWLEQGRPLYRSDTIPVVLQ